MENDRPPSRNRALATKVDASARDRHLFASPVRSFASPLFEDGATSKRPTSSLSSVASSPLRSPSPPARLEPIPQPLSSALASVRAATPDSGDAGPPVFTTDEATCGALLAKERGLIDQVYRDGFLEGYFSDITVTILGDVYYLHRIVLARAGWFRTMLATEWLNETSVEINVDDPNITTASAAITLGGLYGNPDGLSMTNCLSVLACAAYFYLADFAQVVIDFIAQHVTIETIHHVVHFVDGYDYRQYSDQLEDECLRFLFAKGVNLPTTLYRLMPSHWRDRILEADAFWMPSEIDRYRLVRQLYQESKESERAELATLFEQAIIYAHMSFDALATVRQDGLVAAETINRAVWDTWHLQERIQNAALAAPIDIKVEGEMKKSSIAVKTKEGGEHLLFTSPSEETAPLRFGVTFSHQAMEKPAIKKSPTKANSIRIDAEATFYAGSDWVLFLHRDLLPDAHQPWGIFLARALAQKDASGHRVPYVDERHHVVASFKLFCPDLGHEPLYICEKTSFAPSQSWGIRNDVISDCVTKLMATSQPIHFTCVIKIL